MDELIKNRIAQCSEKVNEYDRWLKLLRYPNIIFVIGGSLLAFIGGVLTGLHGWFGCETHQQKCKEIRYKYNSLKFKFKRLLDEDCTKEKFNILDDLFIELESNIDAKPWF
ncbi:hypothetical protein [Thalassotalea piscium]|uniref:Uncharacterized protein n=1 Tax=Thalassotalea piscium TaxID=1230533 RepID=A0A7X0TTT2_9GAMM|nr:hypothetical protein [Thalassotalea piscium]MBB6543449.1 hypothetical protein [Thalassotalea piscium]